MFCPGQVVGDGEAHYLEGFFLFELQPAENQWGVRVCRGVGGGLLQLIFKQNKFEGVCTAPKKNR